MTIFLTGASGLLGNALAQAFQDQNWEVHASVNQLKAPGEKLRIHKLDLSKEGDWERTLTAVCPQIIVNAAALSVPAACENHPQLSYALNVKLPVRLAGLARDLGARIIHFSTDMVFDGKSGNYTPGSPAHPTNLYGAHKLESENRLLEMSPEAATIIRLPLLMGNSPAGNRSVHESLWTAWEKGRVTPLFEDEWRQPVSVSNVAALTVEVVRDPHIQGLFHWAGASRLNRWEIGIRIAGKLGLPMKLLQRSLARNHPQFKDRPLDLTLDSSKLRAQVRTEPAPFENQLEEIQIPRG